MIEVARSGNPIEMRLTQLLVFRSRQQRCSASVPDRYPHKHIYAIHTKTERAGHRSPLTQHSTSGTRKKKKKMIKW